MDNPFCYCTGEGSNLNISSNKLNGLLMKLETVLSHFIERNNHEEILSWLREGKPLDKMKNEPSYNIMEFFISFSHKYLAVVGEREK